jgi:hypothetical protein
MLGCQSAGCGRFEVTRAGYHLRQSENESYELAVVALSTHSGELKHDSYVLPCLSNKAHIRAPMVASEIVVFEELASASGFGEPFYRRHRLRQTPLTLKLIT